MLRFYSQFPFSDKDNSFWLLDLINTSGVFIKRVNTLAQQKMILAFPKGLSAPQLPLSLSIENIDFQEVELNRTSLWREDFFNAFPQFVIGLSAKPYLLNQKKNELLQHWFEFYFYNLELTNGTLENLISLALKIQSDLFQDQVETAELLERLKWDFSNLIILARDTGRYDSSFDYWRLNPTLQILHNQFWTEKKGSYSLWADKKLLIHENILSSEEAQIFHLFEEGLGLNKTQHADKLFQNLHQQEILL